MSTGKPAESEVQEVWRGLRWPISYVVEKSFKMAPKTTYGKGIVDV